MSQVKIIHSLKRYQKASVSGSIRRGYLKYFLPIMLYRTTKTEHPETTRKTIRRVLERVL